MALLRASPPRTPKRLPLARGSGSLNLDRREKAGFEECFVGVVVLHDDVVDVCRVQEDHFVVFQLRRSGFRFFGEVEGDVFLFQIGHQVFGLFFGASVVGVDINKAMGVVAVKPAREFFGAAVERVEEPDFADVIVHSAANNDRRDHTVTAAVTRENDVADFYVAEVGSSLQDADCFSHETGKAVGVFEFAIESVGRVVGALRDDQDGVAFGGGELFDELIVIERVGDVVPPAVEVDFKIDRFAGVKTFRDEHSDGAVAVVLFG